jgi:hypothetical protein
MSRVYLYKLVTDNGGAPCIYRGKLSLAICKPMMRSKAKVGDLVFGFAANSLDKTNRLIYAAHVTKKLSNGRYFKDKRYFKRGDCIYKFAAGRFRWKKGAQHHGPKDRFHDLGSYPKYMRASVLMSSDFRYFGKAGNDKYKMCFPRVKRAVEQLGRGHRVRHSAALQDELFAMGDWVWHSTRKKVLGPPTHARSRDVCHRRGSCAAV